MLQYIGSFSVTGTDEDARARVVETQLQALRVGKHAAYSAIHVVTMRAITFHPVFTLATVARGDPVPRERKRVHVCMHRLCLAIVKDLCLLRGVRRRRSVLFNSLATLIVKRDVPGSPVPPGNPRLRRGNVILRPRSWRD